MAERRVMNKSEFSRHQYGESNFFRLLLRLRAAAPDIAMKELEAVGFKKHARKLTVKQQDVFIKYFN